MIIVPPVTPPEARLARASEATLAPKVDFHAAAPRRGYITEADSMAAAALLHWPGSGTRRRDRRARPWHRRGHPSDARSASPGSRRHRRRPIAAGDGED